MSIFICSVDVGEQTTVSFEHPLCSESLPKLEEKLLLVVSVVLEGFPSVCFLTYCVKLPLNFRHHWCRAAPHDSHVRLKPLCLVSSQVSCCIQLEPKFFTFSLGRIRTRDLAAGVVPAQQAGLTTGSVGILFSVGSFVLFCGVSCFFCSLPATARPTLSHTAPVMFQDPRSCKLGL